MEKKEESNPIISNHFNTAEMKNIKDMEEILKLFNSIENVYYTNYEKERNELLKKEIMSILNLIDSNLQTGASLNNDELSFLYYIKSLSLDKLPEYSKESEESASKSVRK
ncbi:MAG: hypothetical protein MJ252_09345 [archaeon]|nr:hypothetical protein [archaeon]